MKSRRLLELDVFRGMAALIVVLFHYTYRYNLVFNTQTMGLYEFSYGFYGVQLFFIISGFVIFMTLEKVSTGVEFIKRRFIRLYPTFWICMTLTFIVTSFSGIPRFERSLREFLINFTMIPGLLKTKYVDGVYWSLEVELLFYMVMFLVFITKNVNRITIVNYLWLGTNALIANFNIKFLKILLFTDFSYLFIAGISFYKIWKGDKSYYQFLLILFCLIYSFSFKGIEEGLIVSCFFLLFFLFIYKKIGFLSSLKPLVFLGDISFALYLIHQFIGMIIINKLSRYTNSYFLLLIISLGFSITLAWIISKYAEVKISRKLKRVLLK